MKRIKGLCRHGYIVYLPCNWMMKDQMCGIDGKICILKGVVE